MGELATIKIDLLPDGRVRISSVCLDRPDSSYAPLAEERAPAEVEKLLGELRVRLQSDVAAASRRGLAPESVFAALGAERAVDSRALAMMAAHWFEAAGFHISFTFLPSDLVSCVGASGGLLAAAIELRNHLAKSSDGRKALRDLGFEPVPQNVEGE